MIVTPVFFDGTLGVPRREEGAMIHCFKPASGDAHPNAAITAERIDCRPWHRALGRRR
jgi:hypothetical protein